MGDVLGNEQCGIQRCTADTNGKWDSRLLSDAVLELVEENRLHLMKKLKDFLENEEIFAESSKIFRRMPPMPEEIVFDTDISTFLEEEMSLEHNQ